MKVEKGGATAVLCSCGGVTKKMHKPAIAVRQTRAARNTETPERQRETERDRGQRQKEAEKGGLLLRALCSCVLRVLCSYAACTLV